MSIKFKLKGLECPNCAAKIEARIQALDGIADAKLNLMTQSLTLCPCPECESVDFLPAIKDIVHALEPDVDVMHDTGNDEKTHAHTHAHDDDSRRMLILLLFGGVLGCISGILFYGNTGFQTLGIAGFVITWLILGYPVLFKAIRTLIHGQFFDENFLMSIATIGALCIQEYPEAAAVMFLYQLGEFLQGKAISKSKKSIESLLDIRPDMAWTERDGQWVEVPAGEIAVGEHILVKPGGRVPLDGIVIQGNSRLDMRALTGESVPKSVHEGDNIHSGSINQETSLTIEVTKSFSESTASKIIDLVQNASARKSVTESFITRFARYYTPIVVLLAVLTAIILPTAFGFAWSEGLRRSLILLVISCPCALVISIPLTYFGGIGSASRNGILIKGSNYLDLLSRLETIVFDKTGTLTRGTFEVTHCAPAPGISEEDLLNAASLAETESQHPIARSIMKRNPCSEQPDQYEEVAGLGTHAIYKGSDYYAGNARLMQSLNISIVPESHIGTHVYVARDGQYLGCITISDELKPDSASAIRALREHGIKRMSILTGDTEEIARSIAKELGVNDYRAELMPHQKLEQFENISQNTKTAYIGDGINDAPVLAESDVGIAMGALGSDAAIEAADIVLMSDAPSQIPDAISIARRTRQIVIQNIVFALSIKFVLIILGAFGIIDIWLAIFGDVGVMLLASLNAMRMLRYTP